MYTKREDAFLCGDFLYLYNKANQLMNIITFQIDLFTYKDAV